MTRCSNVKVASEPAHVFRWVVRFRRKQLIGELTRALRFTWAVLVVISVHADPSGQELRVIDEAAIPFMGFLSKIDFDQRYPGEMFDEITKLDTGWYVIYTHESLNYHFGPILLESIGEDYLLQLEEKVAAAVALRPSIKGYRLELRYEPSINRSSNSSNNMTSPDFSEQNSPSPKTHSKPSGFWSFVHKIFGLG